MALGRIHSIESMGLLDGPGIRTVVFFQGCKLRCQYCHNPDTWGMQGKDAKLISPKELLQKLNRLRPYYGAQGGVTFSGGEPLLQPEFLLETLALCRDAGIHTCLDTAGCGNGQYEEILSLVDLVLLDIKYETAEGFRRITGHDADQSLAVLNVAQRAGVPLWIRHVVVPGLTDGEAHLQQLQNYINTLKNVQKVELLPYHTLGVHKYHELGIPYPLTGVPPLAAEEIAAFEQKINDDIVYNHREEDYQ